MVKVLRFMSVHEAMLLLQGETVQNTADHGHNGRGGRTTSVGFCFAIAQGETPEYAMHEAAKYLSGITDMEVCLFGTLKTEFTKSEADYSAGHLDELCTTHYSLKDFENWAMYTHSPVHYSVMFRLISSPYWEKPVLLTTSEVARA